MMSEKKTKRGRPTKYRKEMIDLVDKYLEENQDRYEEQLSMISAKGSEVFKQKLVVNLPTIEGFARYLNVASSSVYKWADENQDFSETLRKIMEEQKKRLLNNGLSGDYNSTIAKLILSSNHGMAERSETTNTHKIEDVSEEIKNKIKDIID